MKTAFLLLALIVSVALSLKYYGKKGLLSVLCFAAISMVNEDIRRFLGWQAESVFLALFVIVVLVVYSMQRKRKKGRNKTDSKA
jgi:predicted tellurium resistance membrane protein TerC